MRTRIVFSLKNKGAYVPFHHQHLLSNLIQEILYSPENTLENQVLSYNFSGLKGQTKVSKNGLHFYSSKVTLVFSSIDEKIIKLFLQKLFTQQQIQVGTLLLEPAWVEREQFPKFNNTPVKYLCLSPLVISSSEDPVHMGKRFIAPNNDLFSDLLYESTMVRMEGSGTYTPEQIASFYKFQVVPDKNYLKKIKQDDKKFARIYAVKNQKGETEEIRGYTFPFVLYASGEVQDFVFESGLGAYTNKGFGMLDFASNSIARDVVPYEFN